MNARTLDRVVLAVCAAVLVVIGVGSAFAPVQFYASYGVEVADVDLANELRATGMVVLLLGLAVGAGAVFTRFAFAAAVVAALVALGLALGRALSWAIDGAPASAYVLAGAVELALGLAAGWVAFRTRPRTSRRA